MMLVARLKAFDDGADSAEGEEKTDATAALLRLLLTGSIDTVNDAAAAQLISVAAAAQLATVLEEPPPHQSTQQAPRMRRRTGAPSHEYFATSVLCTRSRMYPGPF